MEREILTRALAHGPECPAIEEIGRYVDGALTARDQQVARAHIEKCAACQGEIALLQSFADARVTDEESSAVRAIVAELQRRPSPIVAPHVVESRASRWISFGMLRATMTATAALLVVAGSYYVFTSQPPRLPRDIDSGREVTRSLTVTLREPVGDKTNVPAQLQWEAVSGATRYHVRVMEVDRSELWSVDVAASAVDLPATVRTQIVPAKTLLWDVTAYDVSNTPIATSNVERFRLVP
jgi:putative zinc finger protein